MGFQKKKRRQQRKLLRRSRGAKRKVIHHAHVLARKEKSAVRRKKIADFGKKLIKPFAKGLNIVEDVVKNLGKDVDNLSGGVATGVGGLGKGLGNMMPLILVGGVLFIIMSNGNDRTSRILKK